MIGHLLNHFMWPLFKLRKHIVYNYPLCFSCPLLSVASASSYLCFYYKSLRYLFIPSSTTVASESSFLAQGWRVPQDWLIQEWRICVPLVAKTHHPNRTLGILWGPSQVPGSCPVWSDSAIWLHHLTNNRLWVTSIRPMPTHSSEPLDLPSLSHVASKGTIQTGNTKILFLKSGVLPDCKLFKNKVIRKRDDG